MFKKITPRFGAPAASKIKSEVVGGKKATFNIDEKEEAAKRIQSINRGKQVRRQGTMGKLMATQKATESPEPRLSRRVSFSGSAKVVAGESCLDQLTAAIQRCTGIAVPGATASGVDIAAEAAAAVRRKEEADAKKAALQLSPALQSKVDALFKAIDDDGNGTITKQEAMKFWKKNWAKVNAQAMFNEVDEVCTSHGFPCCSLPSRMPRHCNRQRPCHPCSFPSSQDAKGEVTQEKWNDFWKNVVAQPDYDEADIIEEMDGIIEGGSWVDWNDGRTT